MSADQTTLPYSAEVEEHLLGACFLHPQVFAEASRWCAGQDFFIGRHRRVWDAVEAMVEKHGQPSFVLLCDQLRANGMSDEDDINLLVSDAVGWIASCENHDKARMWAVELEALGVRRRIIQASGAIANGAYDLESDEAVRQAYQILGDAVERRAPTGETTIAATTQAIFDSLTEGETGRGMATGLPRIDEAQKGLRPGELTILAARTAHGKSALAMQIARQVAGAGTPVSILTLEMDAVSLTERLLAQESGVDVQRVKDGTAKEGDLATVFDAIGALHNLPVTFSVSPATTLPVVRQVVARWADAGLCHLLVVDYLQLVSLGRGGGNRAYEVGAVAQALRDLAQQHRIHVLALAQLNRSVEHRNDPSPVLADLRESGGIEQAADAVWLLHRPELFTRSENDRGVAFVNLAKNRAGPLTTEPLVFDAPTTKFRLLDVYHKPGG